MIEVRYKCRCVGPAIYLDHRERSPLCLSENAPFIGAKPQVQ